MTTRVVTTRLVTTPGMDAALARPVVGNPRSRRVTAAAASSDRRLHQRLIGRDPLALADAHTQFHGAVFGMAMRVTGDRHMAEDVAQEVFVGFWRRPECFNPGRGSMRTWLTTVARYRAIDALRVEEAVRRRIDREACMRIDQVPDIGDVFEAHQNAESLWTALQRLDEPRRRAIVLAYFGGRTYRQVADDLGVAEGTIKSRIRTGLHQLAIALSPETIGQAC